MLATTIPLFPLNLVLFPGMSLPLQIFEPRYKEMISWCLEHDKPFGVVLIREGEEVGASAEPYEVGTLARITESRTLPNGRILLQTRGTRRFRITRLLHDKPYLQGEVETIDESLIPSAVSDQGLARLAERALEGFRQYLELLKDLGGQVGQLSDSDIKPEFLSWVIGATLIAPSELRQELLEIETTLERLTRELTLMDQACNRLRSRLDRKKHGRSYPFSLN